MDRHCENNSVQISDANIAYLRNLKRKTGCNIKFILNKFLDERRAHEKERDSHRKADD